MRLRYQLVGPCRRLRFGIAALGQSGLRRPVRMGHILVVRINRPDHPGCVHPVDQLGGFAASLTAASPLSEAPPTLAVCSNRHASSALLKAISNPTPRRALATGWNETGWILQ